MIDADSIAVVLDVLEPERAALIALLEGLEPTDWIRPTECPAYTIKGVATHVLGDDLSLLSRQRDGAEDGLVPLAHDRPGADFRTLIDAFNDRWVATAGFLSTELVVELLRLTGAWIGRLLPRRRSGSSRRARRVLRESWLELAVLAGHRSRIRRALGA